MAKKRKRKRKPQGVVEWYEGRPWWVGIIVMIGIYLLFRGAF